jgi:hypothetical protein
VAEIAISLLNMPKEVISSSDTLIKTIGFRSVLNALNDVRGVVFESNNVLQTCDKKLNCESVLASNHDK